MFNIFFQLPLLLVTAKLKQKCGLHVSSFVIITKLFVWMTLVHCCLSRNTLNETDRLYEGDYLESKNGKYRLYMGYDGNLQAFIFNNTFNNSIVFWETQTGGNVTCCTYYLKMQLDNNLVIYDMDTPLWASDTHQTSVSIDTVYFRLENNRNLVIRALNSTSTIIWQTNTDISIPPTQFPSVIPSNYPSNIPTIIPSNYPSNYPSKMPSNIPSNIPTKNPSALPTTHPSLQPSIKPTIEPSIEPTVDPTASSASLDFQTTVNIINSVNTSISSKTKKTKNTNNNYNISIVINVHLLVGICIGILCLCSIIFGLIYVKHKKENKEAVTKIGKPNILNEQKLVSSSYGGTDINTASKDIDTIYKSEQGNHDNTDTVIYEQGESGNGESGNGESGHDEFDIDNIIIKQNSDEQIVQVNNHDNLLKHEDNDQYIQIIYNDQDKPQKKLTMGNIKKNEQDMDDDADDADDPDVEALFGKVETEGNLETEGQ